jgi:hypothetical protein
MERDEAEAVVEGLLTAHDGAVEALQSAASALSDVEGEISDLVKDIRRMKNERRGLRGADRDYLNWCIDNAYSDFDGLKKRRQDAGKDMRECNRCFRTVRSEMKRMVGRLKRVLDCTNFTAPSLPVQGPFSSTSGLHTIRQAYEQASSFALVLLQRLETALNASIAGARTAPEFGLSTREGNADFTAGQGDCGIEEDFHTLSPGENRYVVVMQGGEALVSTVGPMDDVVEGETDVLAYNVVDARDGRVLVARSVPFKAFTLPPNRWDAGERSQEIFGVDTAMAWMAARGRRAIVALGGPGRPDILSLTRNGKLVRSEVKGTFSDTSLGASGLFRSRKVSRMEQISLSFLPQIWDGKGPAKDSISVAENSREWIAISAGSILRHLDQVAAQMDDPQLKADYSELADRFRSSYLEGRLVEEGSEVIQVGRSADGLPDPADSMAVHQYCEVARPSQIVQINVGT